MQCLNDEGGGWYSLQSPQPADYTVCTYLIIQPSDLPSDVWNLTIEEAQVLMPYFGLLLLAGFTFRAIARALSVDER